jgi:hypothetical protein
MHTSSFFELPVTNTTVCDILLPVSQRDDALRSQLIVTAQRDHGAGRDPQDCKIGRVPNAVSLLETNTLIVAALPTWWQDVNSSSLPNEEDAAARGKNVVMESCDHQRPVARDCFEGLIFFFSRFGKPGSPARTESHGSLCNCGGHVLTCCNLLHKLALHFRPLPRVSSKVGAGAHPWPRLLCARSLSLIQRHLMITFSRWRRGVACRPTATQQALCKSAFNFAAHARVVTCHRAIPNVVGCLRTNVWWCIRIDTEYQLHHHAGSLPRKRAACHQIAAALHDVHTGVGDAGHRTRCSLTAAS